MVKGIAWDFDGVIANTEPLNYAANREVLARRGVVLTKADFCQIWVRLGKGLGEFLARKELPYDENELRAERLVVSRRLHLESPLEMDGIGDALRGLDNAGYLQSIVSSGHKDDVDHVLELIGLRYHFDPVITRQDVREPKPSPEGFLLASRYMEVVPSSIVVIGDSEKDILGAARAGMKSVAIPTSYTSNHDFSQAHRILSSVREVTPELIESLF